MVINHLLWMGKQKARRVTYFITLVVDRSCPGRTGEINVEKTVKNPWQWHDEPWLRGNPVFQGGGTVGDGDSNVIDTSSPAKLRSAEHTGILLVPVFSERCLHPGTLG